jgi:predicted lipoprotein with Yx(FWY)xxD motif
LSLSAFAAPPTKMADGVLVDSKGMTTLYTFDKDSGGNSVCNVPCLVNRPPLMATAADKP